LAPLPQAPELLGPLAVHSPQAPLALVLLPALPALPVPLVVRSQVQVPLAEHWQPRRLQPRRSALG